MASHDKGQRYLGQLDEALCQGTWTAVAELARKVDKHAPNRKLLTFTARTEAQVASTTRRPNTAASVASNIPDAEDVVSKLIAAINESDGQPADDIYCAQVCLAGIHWIQHEYANALKVLPRNLPKDQKDGQNGSLGWMEVCVVKGAFIRATALERTEQKQDASRAYIAAASKAPGSRSPELRRWTERLLATACMFVSTTSMETTSRMLSDNLRVFRAWKDFWQRTAPPPVTGQSGVGQNDNPRRKVWQSYHHLLSRILRSGLLYAPSGSSDGDLLYKPGSVELPSDAYQSSRVRQLAELQSVQTTYESLLLNETQFPKASENNVEVEEWVAEAAANWKILHGPTWSEAELGTEGREGIDRGLLNILYRAANKTFHSTTVLRYLFEVHASLGEYDLALRAFQSYEEIMDRGKARALKTGQHELGLDDDDTAIITAAEAIRVLCRYGGYEQGRQAVKIGKTIQKWLLQAAAQPSTGVNEGTTDSPDAQTTTVSGATSSPEPLTLSRAYRAIGISQANWARLTYEVDARTSLQAEAIANLKKAESLEPGDIETSFALARTLAETRDLSSAIEILKNSISVATVQDGEAELDEIAERAQQRRLMPLWHLLSFCLTAKEEYETAMKVCGAAFDQFDSLSVLFGPQAHGATDSAHGRVDYGLVEQMDSLEKEAIMQIKMTQLAFLEITDGASAAVDKADELLLLFKQLYGWPDAASTSAPPKTPKTAVSTSPSRGVGTLRSIAGTIRPKSVRASIERDDPRRSSLAPSPRAPVSSGQGGAAIEKNTTETESQLTLTSSNGQQAHSPKSQTRHHLHLPFRGRGQSTSAGVGVSSDKRAQDEKLTALPRTVDANPPVIDSTSISNAISHSLSPDTPAGPQQALREIEHNGPASQWPPPSGHKEQPPQQDVRLPVPPPTAPESRQALPRAKAHERQHNVGLLTSIWLFIARLYIEAEHFDDAKGAIDEADHTVVEYEQEATRRHSGIGASAVKGWGGGACIDELRADVYAARGNLADAQQHPHQALALYEQALASYPDHAAGILGISDLLMDIYEEKLPAEEPVSLLGTSGTQLATPQTSAYLPRTGVDKSSFVASISGRQLLVGSKDPTPSELNRLAARDRAYMLLSNLTKSGQGWDNAEAWFRLARSFELSKQVDKAKQALWWVVELEDHRPVRPWSNVAAGGYTL